MSGIKFIHIADIHYHIDNYDSEKMRSSLFRYLSTLSSQQDYDFLIMTGDFTNRGNPFTATIVEFIDALLNALKLSRSQAYLVPGNHDLVRDGTRSLLIEGIKANPSPSDKLDSSLRDETTRNLLFKGFQNYMEFYKEFTGEDYPISEVHFVKECDKYNIIHLNSCLLAYTSREEGTLRIGKQKLLECLSPIQNEGKINIAIGHHSLECFAPDDVRSINANFEDYHVDLYLSGHVHQPGYHINANGNSNIISLVSGAGMIDGYASGGFISGNFSFETANLEVQYHIWNTDNEFWTVNNSVGRQTQNGVLTYCIQRLKDRLATEESSDLDGDFDEDEFKQFVIDFHQHPRQRGNMSSYNAKRTEIEQKFENMRCSPSFERMFLTYATYFSAIDEIMNSTSYIATDKKDIVSEIVIETYLDIHNSYTTGDKIFAKLVDEIHKEYEGIFHYSRHQTRRYIRILVAWTIYDCSIFNEKKGEVEAR